MAEDLTTTPQAEEMTPGVPVAPPPEMPLPADPGGGHAKGYSADPGPGQEVPADGPLPLAEGPDKHPAFHVPERDKHVRPTGRSEPGDYGPNDRLRGSDR